MLRYLFCAGLGLLSVNLLFAQELPKTYDAPVELGKSDQRRLERANELIREGIDLWNQLTEKYNPKNATTYKIDSAYNKDAYPLLMKASEVFQEGNQLKYDIYHKNCSDFWTKHRYDYPSGLENAKRFQEEATEYLDKAQINRRLSVNFENQYVKTYERLYEAISLELIAGKKEGRALQIYSDWPVHYSYDWDEDIEKNLFAAPVVAQVDTEKVEKPVVTAPPKPIEQPPVTPHDSTIIYYSVQIAAHTIPMTESYIRQNIYHGGMTIRQIHEDGWYKYLIGRYKNVDEANKLLNSINVEKAFVVAYRNGKRVPVSELNPEPEKKP